MSYANDLARAAESALLDVPLFVGRVSRSIEKGYSYDNFPSALLHQIADVPSGQSAPIGCEYRVLTLELEILADGEVPHDACDAALTLAHPAMMSLAPQTSASAVSWRYDEENPALGIVTAQYQITYRRLEGEL